MARVSLKKKVRKWSGIRSFKNRERLSCNHNHQLTVFSMESSSSVPLNLEPSSSSSSGWPQEVEEEEEAAAEEEEVEEGWGGSKSLPS